MSESRRVTNIFFVENFVYRVAESVWMYYSA